MTELEAVVAKLQKVGECRVQHVTASDSTDCQSIRTIDSVVPELVYGQRKAEFATYITVVPYAKDS